MKLLPALLFATPLFANPLVVAETAADRLATVTNTPGLVAFWDFEIREAEGARWFTAHVPAGATDDYTLDAANYIRYYWNPNGSHCASTASRRLKSLCAAAGKPPATSSPCA